MALIKFKRGTYAQLLAAANAGQLNEGEPYLITDTGDLAIGIDIHNFLLTTLAAPSAVPPPLFYAPLLSDLTVTSGTGSLSIDRDSIKYLRDANFNLIASAINVPAFAHQYDSGNYSVTGYGDSWIGTFLVGSSVGDYISGGYAYRNQGTGGHTLSQIKSVFDGDFPNPGDNLVILQGGTNDISSAISDPNSEMRAAMAAMIADCENNGIEFVVLNIPPFKSDILNRWTTDRQSWLESYNAWLWTNYSDRVVDIYGLLTDGDDALALKYNSGDGIHPSYNGLHAVDKAIAQFIGNDLKAFLVFEPTSSNLCLCAGLNPESTAGIEIKGLTSGTTFTVVDDSAAIAESELANISDGNVYKIDNTTGTNVVTADIKGGATGVVPHTFSVYARRGANSAACYVTYSNAANKVLITDQAYFRYESAYTPPGVWIKARIEVAVGGVIYFILPQYEPRSTMTSVIPATVSGATRQKDKLTAPLANISNTAGTIYLEADLSDWTTGELIAGMIAPSATNGVSATHTDGVEVILNGGFNADTTGWFTNAATTTLTAQDGALNILSAAGDNGYAIYDIANADDGDLYRLSFDVVACNKPEQIRIGCHSTTTATAADTIEYSTGTITVGNRHFREFLFDDYNRYLYFGGRSDVNELVLDNISLQKVISTHGPSLTPSGWTKIALRYGDGKMRVAVNGSLGAEADFGGDWNLSQFSIGAGTTGKIRNVKTWSLALSDTTLESMTTP